MLLPDLEIRARLSRYLSGSLSLDDFEDWFVPVTWDIERHSESAAKLAAEIRSGLFRISTGEATEDDFRALARSKVDEIVWDAKPPSRTDSDAPLNETVKREFA